MYINVHNTPAFLSRCFTDNTAQVLVLPKLGAGFRTRPLPDSSQAKRKDGKTGRSKAPKQCRVLSPSSGPRRERLLVTSKGLPKSRVRNIESPGHLSLDASLRMPGFALFRKGCGVQDNSKSMRVCGFRANFLSVWIRSASLLICNRIKASPSKLLMTVVAFPSSHDHNGERICNINYSFPRRPLTRQQPRLVVMGELTITALYPYPRCLHKRRPKWFQYQLYRWKRGTPKMVLFLSGSFDKETRKRAPTEPEIWVRCHSD